MVNTRPSSSNRHLTKGISPVIATILMVMITVILVAFSYTWMQGMTSTAQESTGSYVDSTEKMNQRVIISTIYGNSTGVYFELKADTSNKYPLDMNGTTYYIDNVPKNVTDWNGGLGGVSCRLTSLVAGARCYGTISGVACTPGSVVKVALGWGYTTQATLVECK
jgi:flagellin-like protein